jgi:hypothetical protein
MNVLSHLDKADAEGESYERPDDEAACLDRNHHRWRTVGMEPRKRGTNVRQKVRCRPPGGWV